MSTLLLEQKHIKWCGSLTDLDCVLKELDTCDDTEFRVCKKAYTEGYKACLADVEAWSNNNKYCENCTLDPIYIIDNKDLLEYIASLQCGGEEKK